MPLYNRIRPARSTLCASCWVRQQIVPLRQKRHARRFATALGDAAAKNPAFTPPSHATDTAWDDKTLRQIFDDAQAWKSYSNTSQPRTGLFQNRDLTSPAGFRVYTGRTLQKAHALVEQIVSSHTREDLSEVVKRLDLLSDLLCRVIDMSDFVRATHPDSKTVAAATEAYSAMYEYMNVLNTMTGLYHALKRALDDPEVVAGFSHEERAVADILYRDFEKSGIDLPAAARQKFVELSNEIAELGPKFVDGVRPKTGYVEFESSRLRGMDPMVVRELTKRGKVILPTIGMSANHALRTVEDPEVRKELYLAAHTSPDSQIRTLETLLQRRSELASLLGAESYAHLTLADKMAGSPDAINQFLTALSTANRPAAQSELQILADLKRASGQQEPLQPWDKDFYSTRLRQSLRSRQKSQSPLSSYFSLGTVMQGISRVFTRLYGLRLVPVPPSPGETWNPDVRRLDILSDTSGRVGVMYCDLFSRPYKNPNPAHFTIRCSRAIPAGDDSDGMAATPTHQLPTIALICDFPAAEHGPTLLSYREVTTIFHEMGHALHSFLGRTDLHNVAGTRCATDWAEFPSILTEQFVRHPDVLRLFARHYEDDSPVHFPAVDAHIRADDVQAALETRAQIVLAAGDLALHTARERDSGAVWRGVVERWGLLEEPGSWQGFFGHLFGYGAAYYAYLFDRAIADYVWRTVFVGGEGGVLGRESGDRLEREVLRWGGSRSGWACLAGVTGRAELEKGGEEGMRVVGEWGAGLK